MTLDTVTLSRLQFAFTIAYHIMWPAYSIGIAGFIVLLNALWLRTGNVVYRELMRFWIRLFALGFVMGVVTGVVLSYEIGANWSGFSRVTGNITGPLLMYEALTAFFLEGGFIGIVLFGEARVGPRMHFFSCCMVTLGTLLSAFWVLAANSWMQTPQGATLRKDKVFHVNDWVSVIFNPSFPYRFAHMVCASYITGVFVVAGVSAIFLLRKSHREFAETGLSLAMWIALFLMPLQMILGDQHGQNTRQYQPMKLAAIVVGPSARSLGSPCSTLSMPAISKWSGANLNDGSARRQSNAGSSPAVGGCSGLPGPLIAAAAAITDSRICRRCSTSAILSNGTGSVGLKKSCKPSSDQPRGVVNSGHQPRSRSAWRSSNSNRSGFRFSL